MTKPALDKSQITISLLDRQALLQINGADAKSFLQGQLSCDMKDVSQFGSRLAAHCNPKGSMHSVMRVIDFNDSFLLRCNTQNLTYTKENLSKYMMFSKAECNDLSSSWQGVGFSGRDAHIILNQYIDSIPSNTDQVSTQDTIVIIKVPGERFELWMPNENFDSFIKSLQIQIENSDTWYKEEITQGIADIYPETREQYIPQMCNLQALDGVSFRKGCYTGQEVITRLHFRGKLTKYLITAKVEANHAEEVNRGDDIFDSEGNKIANILQYSFKGDWLYLQLIINKKHDDQTMYLSSKVVLSMLDQPYELDPNLFIRKA